MGVVYEVEHRLTGHRRALKLVHAKYADRPRFMKRLLREAKIAGTLSTPYVVETYDAGRLEDGSAYVLMELLDGRTLYDIQQEEGRLAPRRLAEIMSQVAEGMSVAHEEGVIHRDLKPENIFVVADAEGNERVKILDFGVSKLDESGDVARLTVEGTLVGTPYYMSPEQAAGRSVDARSDVYAMGVMMYEALAGRLPYEAESVGALFVKIGAGDCVPLRIRRPDLDEAWCELVHQAFHRNPGSRFASAEALRRELVQLLGGGSTAARAKTISDGPHASVHHGSSLPPPPATPQDALDSEPEPPELPEDDDEALALSAPPLRRQREPEGDALAKRGTPRISPWLWAAGGALVVALLALPWLRAEDPPAPAPIASRAATPPAAPEEDREPATPLPAPAPRAEAADAGAPTDTGEETAPRPAVRRTRARAAGLDPNPYH